MKSITVLMIGMSALLILSGCSREVADCNDENVNSAIKSNMVSFAEAVASAKGNAEIPIIFKKGKKYLDEFQVSLSEVTQEGYQKDSNRRSCKAVAEMGEPIKSMFSFASGTDKSKTVEKMPTSIPINYNLIGLVDQNGEFKYEEISNKDSGIDLFSMYSIFLVKAIEAKVLNDELSGSWSGDYICSGMDGAQDGPQGPYKLQVVMNASMSEKGIQLALNRTTKGGGVEKLTGVANVSGDVKIVGTGMNSDDDKWNTEFVGKYANEILSAKGNIKTQSGELLRSCELQLNKNK